MGLLSDPSGELRFWCSGGGAKLKGQRLLWKSFVDRAGVL